MLVGSRDREGEATDGIVVEGEKPCSATFPPPAARLSYPGSAWPLFLLPRPQAVHSFLQGALTAWFRLRYPHLAIGAVASSATVERLMWDNFYLENMAFSYRFFGGQQCIDAFSNATQRIVRLLANGTSAYPAFAKLFQLCDVPKSHKDLYAFFDASLEVLENKAQYADSQGTEIKDACSTMLDEQGNPDILDRYAEVVRAKRPIGCNNYSWAKTVYELSAETHTDRNSRSWEYMRCADYGGFRSSSKSKEPFGPFLPVSYFLERCRAAFNLTELPRVFDTQSRYGGRNFSGTNVVFVNGNIDPLHGISITQPVKRPGLTIIYLNGTSHCADMRATDFPDAQMASAWSVIEGKMSEWISEWWSWQGKR